MLSLSYILQIFYYRIISPTNILLLDYSPYKYFNTGLFPLQIFYYSIISPTNILLLDKCLLLGYVPYKCFNIGLRPLPSHIATARALLEALRRSASWECSLISHLLTLDVFCFTYSTNIFNAVFSNNV